MSLIAWAAIQQSELKLGEFLAVIGGLYCFVQWLKLTSWIEKNEGHSEALWFKGLSTALLWLIVWWIA